MKWEPCWVGARQVGPERPWPQLDLLGMRGSPDRGPLEQHGERDARAAALLASRFACYLLGTRLVQGRPNCAVQALGSRSEGPSTTHQARTVHPLLTRASVGFQKKTRASVVPLNY